MLVWQQIVILLFGIINFFLCVKGYDESKYKKNAFGFTLPFSVFGIFVWGDAVIFGMFWTVVSMAMILLQDWYLFLLTFSLFWVIRSLGETIYWFNQQFSTVNRNPPAILPFYSVFHNDSIWFIYQTVMQCITVISLLVSIYFAHLWIQTLP